MSRRIKLISFHGKPIRPKASQVPRDTPAEKVRQKRREGARRESRRPLSAKQSHEDVAEGIFAQLPNPSSARIQAALLTKDAKYPCRIEARFASKNRWRGKIAYKGHIAEKRSVSSLASLSVKQSARRRGRGHFCAKPGQSRAFLHAFAGSQRFSNEVVPWSASAGSRCRLQGKARLENPSSKIPSRRKK